MDDYFGGTTAGAPGWAGSPAPAASPTPGTLPYAAAPPVWPAAPPPSFQYVLAPTSGSTVRNVVLALAAGLSVVIVIGILAAVAIPVFLHQRELAARTSVAIPAQLAGMPRLTGTTGRDLEQRLSDLPTPGTHLAGAFGQPGRLVAVGVTKYPMSPSAQRGYLVGAERGAAREVPGLDFADSPPGHLGGSMRCARLPNEAMTCFFVDAGAYGTVIVVGAGAAAPDVALQAREAVESRR